MTWNQVKIKLEKLCNFFKNDIQMMLMRCRLWKITLKYFWEKGKPVNNFIKTGNQMISLKHLYILWSTRKRNHSPHRKQSASEHSTARLTHLCMLNTLKRILPSWLIFVFSLKSSLYIKPYVLMSVKHKCYNMSCDRLQVTLTDWLGIKCQDTNPSNHAKWKPCMYMSVISLDTQWKYYIWSHLMM